MVRNLDRKAAGYVHRMHPTHAKMATLLLEVQQWRFPASSTGPDDDLWANIME